MNATPGIDEIIEALDWCFQAQVSAVDLWHLTEPEQAPKQAEEGKPDLDRFKDLVLDEHLVNFLLWHAEDEARREDAGPDHVADCKRRIDRLNQNRNDAIEAMDDCLVAILQPLVEKAADRHNTETVGGALDRLSILSLKRYHMAEQARRPDAPISHREACDRRLAILHEQHADLRRAILELVREYGQGLKRPKVYRQFKMYNDPELNPQLYGRK